MARMVDKFTLTSFNEADDPACGYQASINSADDIDWHLAEIFDQSVQ